MKQQKPNTSAKSTSHLQTALQLFSYFWSKEDTFFRFRLLSAAFFLIFSKVVAVFIPIFYKQAVDALSLENHQLTLTLPLGILIAYGLARLFSTICSEAKDALFAKLEHLAIKRIALRVFEHLHTLSLKFHLDRKTGKLSRIIERGTNAIDRALRFLTFTIIPTFLEIGFVVVMLLYLYEPIFAVVTFLSSGLYALFTIKITQWRLKFLRTMNDADDASNSKAIDSLLNYETVKYFVNEDHEKSRFETSLEVFGRAAIRLKTSLAYLNMGQSFIISAGTVIIMLLAAQRIIEGTMTLGDFVLVNAYLLQLYIPLGNLGFAYREIKQALINIEDMFNLLDEKIDVADPPQARSLVKGPGHVLFDKVSFQYNNDRQILKNVTFEVPAGKTVAIVGPSGSGKSTIARLLCRFYDVNSGAILIDNQDIRAIKQKSLRQALGVVPQDTVLFNDSLGYNIDYGKPGSSKKAIEHAAHMAELDRFIKKLPQGYETLVGERGLKLSGGEKQRVAIARTILKSPEIFIFDEATSSLDSSTEKSIQKNILKVSKGRSTIIIAHRLSTIVEAHNIIVLSNGEITEQGTHHQLMDKQGLYMTMWQQQQKENNT